VGLYKNIKVGSSEVNEIVYPTTIKRNLNKKSTHKVGVFDENQPML